MHCWPQSGVRSQLLDLEKDKDAVAIAAPLIGVIDTIEGVVCCSSMSAEQRRQGKSEDDQAIPWSCDSKDCKL